MGRVGFNLKTREVSVRTTQETGMKQGRLVPLQNVFIISSAIFNSLPGEKKLHFPTEGKIKKTVDVCRSLSLLHVGILTLVLWRFSKCQARLNTVLALPKVMKVNL